MPSLAKSAEENGHAKKNQNFYGFSFLKNSLKPEQNEMFQHFTISVFFQRFSIFAAFDALRRLTEFLSNSLLDARLQNLTRINIKI